MRFDQRRLNTCEAVAATITVTDTSIEGTPGHSVAKNGSMADAASATGAENPTSNEVHPASDPRNGCQRSER